MKLLNVLMYLSIGAYEPLCGACKLLALVKSATCNDYLPLGYFTLNVFTGSKAMQWRIRVHIQGRVASVTDDRLLQVCYR